MHTCLEPMSYEGLITRDAFNKAFRNAGRIVHQVAETIGEGRGGWEMAFYEAPRALNMPTFVRATIGIVPAQKREKYSRLVIEKPRRGASLLLPNDFTPNSYVAERDPEKDQWGGAFALFPGQNSPWISCSGLPELSDIVLCAYVAQRTRIIDLERVLRIFHAHGPDVRPILVHTFGLLADACTRVDARLETI